jgi:putative endonuclease
MFVVYVLRSKLNGILYVGQTGNFLRRMIEHETGLARFTRGRGPWELIYKELYNLRAEAISREKFLKSGKGREWLKNLFELI